jgi:hypothetical protein
MLELKRREFKRKTVKSNNPRLMMKGERFGRLVATRFAECNSKGETFWWFKCDCGKDVKKRLHNVKQGGTMSCGCLRRENASARHGKIPDIVGQSYGAWEVVAREADSIDEDHRHTPMVRCRCVCGTERVLAWRSLKHGQSQSCGCGQIPRSDFEKWCSEIGQSCEAVFDHARLTGGQRTKIKAGILDESISATSCRKLLDLGCPSHLLPTRKHGIELIPCAFCGAMRITHVDDVLARARKGELFNCGCSLETTESLKISRRSLWTGFEKAQRKTP